MSKLLLVLMPLLSACTALPTAEVTAFLQAKANFSYKADDGDDWVQFTSINRPFEGDCEDFAFTLERAVGGDVWYVFLPSGQAHAVLLKDEIVYDNLRSYPAQVEKVKLEGVSFLFPMKGKKPLTVKIN